MLTLFMLFLFFPYSCTLVLILTCTDVIALFSYRFTLRLLHLKRLVAFK